MATLSSALNYALSGLSVTAAQSALVSRNVSFAGDENYTHKSAEIYTLPSGAAAISAPGRSMDRQLLAKFLGSASDASSRQAVLDAVNQIAATVGDPEDEDSVAALVGKLQTSLSTYETNPSSETLAATALESARSVVSKLNASSAEVIGIRAEADKAIVQSVDHINTLLAQFKVVNDSIVRGSGTATDLAENLDQRDSILKLLSEEIGIRTVSRNNNDLVIYADGGTVLFEGSPRSVTVTGTPVFDPVTAGQDIQIDGALVSGPAAVMPVTTGKLAALVKVRDEITVQMQQQLDEVASGLIRNFAESDRSVPPALPDVAGLFVDSAGGLPTAGTVSTGLASRLRLNPLADPRVGGTPRMIRDGGFGGPSYVYNSAGSSGYQGRIAELIGTFDMAMDFDAVAGLGSRDSLKAFGRNSAAWVESLRQSSQAAADKSSATRVRTDETLLRVTGVNIDQEMATLLDLEKSYQASSKIISVIGSMLDTLLESVR